MDAKVLKMFNFFEKSQNFTKWLEMIRKVYGSIIWVSEGPFFIHLGRPGRSSGIIKRDFDVDSQNSKVMRKK